MTELYCLSTITIQPWNVQMKYEPCHLNIKTLLSSEAIGIEQYASRKSTGAIKQPGRMSLTAVWKVSILKWW